MKDNTKAKAADATNTYGGLVTQNHNKSQIVLVRERGLECPFNILEAWYGRHPDDKIWNIEVYRYKHLKRWIDSRRFSIAKMRYERRIPPSAR